MDIGQLKEAIGDERFSELETYIGDLTSQRDQARNESIDKRKALQATVKTLEQQQSTLFEKLGVDSIDEIDDLPDSRGAAEAAKQYEVKLKRLERELETKDSALQQAETKFRDSQRSLALSAALDGHKWLAKDVVEGFVTPRLTWEDDQLLYKTDDEKLVSVKDGIAELAKARPELLEPTGTGGAGVNTRKAGGQDGKTMTRADFDAASQQQRAEFVRSGGRVSEAA